MIEEILAKLSTPEQILMFAAGVLFVCTQWLAGKKSRATWYVGLVGNAVWYSVVFVGQNWALLLLVVAMTWVNTRNLLAWRQAPVPAAPEPTNPRFTHETMTEEFNGRQRADPGADSGETQRG